MISLARKSEPNFIKMYRASYRGKSADGYTEKEAIRNLELILNGKYY
jgi:hypothetical protein